MLVIIRGGNMSISVPSDLVLDVVNAASPEAALFRGSAADSPAKTVHPDRLIATPQNAQTNTITSR